MEKKIYNNKTKKILISFVIIVLLFGYILPFKSYATNSYAYGSINGYIKLITGQETVGKAWNKFKKKAYKTQREELITELEKNALKGLSRDKIEQLITLNDGKDYYFSNTIYIRYSDDGKFEPNSSEFITQNDWALPGILRAIFKISEHLMFEEIVNSCESIINEIKNAAPDTTTIVGGIKDGKIIMRFKVKEITDVENAFKKYLITEGASNAKAISNNEYNHVGLIVEKIDPNTLIEEGEGQEDTRTEEEIIKDLLIYKYDGLDSQEADLVIVEEMFNVTERDENGNPTDVELKDVPYETLQQFGLSNESEKEALEEVNENLKAGEDESDLGGILLAPVFMLINFANDAILYNLCDIMIGDGIEGWQVLTGQVLFAGVGNILSETKKEPATEDLSNAVTVNVGSFTFGYQYPNIPYTPEEIFSGKVDLFSIDFISGKLPKRDANGEYVKDENGNVVYETNPDEDWMSIRSVIASWYKVLRMIAIIGLLSVLIYTGIKIMLSANAKDKAKYKEWIMNWFIAVAILFSMHYIMSFINAIITEINVLLDDACQEIIVHVDGGADGKVEKGLSEYFATNLMGLVRFMIQSAKFKIKVGYEGMYIALLVYTIKFTVVYLKRVLNMAFLTLIAPIVALTYPIDKLNDGRAQGFDMWLKEYIFNALLQPMHYIMYYILMGAAATIAASNPIYGIVVLMFMSEAEKLLKKIFGFDKASGGTVGGMSGAFAAGAIASNVGRIVSSLSKGKSGGGGGGSSKPEAIDSPKPTEKPDFAETFDGDDGGASASNLSENNEQQGTTQQRMLDAYDEENFGTDGYDSAEREAMAREAYQPEGQEASDEELRQMLADQGYSEEEIEDTLADRNGSSSPQLESQSASEPELVSGPEPQSSTPIRDMAKSVAGGALAVGKHIAKPIWDFDKSGKYNGKRLLRKIGKGVLKGVGGFALGTAAAAVQAGISITDGKYNPMEGIATFSAGFAGAGGLVDRAAGGIGTLADAYRSGASAGDKKAQMKRAQGRFADRDDVIAFNKKEYAGKEKEYMQRERDHYLTAGVTDLKDMKRCMKYADSMVKTNGLTAEQIEQARKKADAKAAATLDFRKTLQDQGQLSTVYDQKKQKAYIDEMVKQAERNGGDGTRTRRQYENAFKSIVAYDAANR